MNDLDQLLDDALRDIADGRTTLDKFLKSHPAHARDLAPLLRAAVRLERGRALLPSRDFKRKARARVITHARAHPPRHLWLAHPSWRMAVGMALLLLVSVATTTAFAQAALPGQPLYTWKLTSERVWRTLALDPVGADLTLADRRATELTDVANAPGPAAQALEGYHEVLSRLQAEDNSANGPRIEKALEAHQKKLSEAGINDPQLNDILHGKP